MGGTEGGLTRSEYFEERKMLIEARSRGYQRLDQMVTGGAAATLIFTLTSSDKIIEQPRSYSAELLTTSWALLLVSLSLSFVAQYFSARAFTHELAVLNEDVAANAPNRWQRRSTVAGVCSTVLFVAGIGLIALVAFTSRSF